MKEELFWANGEINQSRAQTGGGGGDPGNNKSVCLQDVSAFYVFLVMGEKGAIMGCLTLRKYNSPPEVSPFSLRLP